MTRESFIKGITILAVDDEIDILDTIEELLDEARVDKALDYEDGLRKIKANPYDLAILDIMGVNGLKLLEETVSNGIPTIMLTAHAVNTDTLIESIRKGAISYLPKEQLGDLDDHLNRLMGAHEKGEPTWKLLFEMLGDYFDKRFGPGWKDEHKAFWDEFDQTYDIGRGIQQRLLHDDRVRDKGI